MKNCLFEGVGTALITPFKNGKVDYVAFKNLIERQIINGISSLIILGTTGEPSLLTYYEYEKICNFCVETVNKRVPVIIGVGSNSTEIAVKKSLIAKKACADGLLAVTPYYSKCTKTGIIKHYSEITEKSCLKTILYNVPKRTGFNLTPNILEKLLNNDLIVGIKEASGDIKQIKEVANLIKDKIALYSGDDYLNLKIYSLGGIGAISVTSNLLPKTVSEVYKFYSTKKYKSATKLQNSLKEINKALFLEVNPVPIKFALEELKLISGEIRLPLTRLENTNQEYLKSVLKNYEKEILCQL